MLKMMNPAAAMRNTAISRLQCRLFLRRSISRHPCTGALMLCRSRLIHILLKDAFAYSWTHDQCDVAQGLTEQHCSSDPSYLHCLLSGIFDLHRWLVFIPVEVALF